MYSKSEDLASSSVMGKDRSILLLLIAFVVVASPQPGGAGEPPAKPEIGESGESVTEVRIQTLSHGHGIQKVALETNASSVQEVDHPDEPKGVDDMADKTKGDGGKSGKKDLDAFEPENTPSKKKALGDDENPAVALKDKVDGKQSKNGKDGEGDIGWADSLGQTAAGIETTTQTTSETKAAKNEPHGVSAQNRQSSGSSSSRQHEDDLIHLKNTGKESAMTSAPEKTTLDVKLGKSNENPDERGGMTSLAIGVIFGVILTGVLLFVGLKRLDAIRRRREYRKMNDFLIDGMYNDL